MRAFELHRLRDPLMWANASQLAKTVAAAVVAWVVAVDVFHLSQAFMAPWAAVLTVEATVFGSVRGGAQQAAASVVGVLIAFAAGQLFGLNALSLGLAVLVGLAIGTVPGLRAQATTAATTAIVVLTTGYSANDHMLAARLGDTGIGIAVGLLINLAVWPPLRDRSAARQIDVIDDRVGDLFKEIAEHIRRGFTDGDVDGWIARADELDDDVDRAWRVLGEARESARLNPRRSVPERMRATETFAAILTRLAQALAEARSMAHTIRIARVAPDQWDPEFREPWLDLLHRIGEAVADADTAALAAARDDLTALGNRLAAGELHGDLWPIYGALLVNLRNVGDALDPVTGAQPVRVSATVLSS
jgi:uncharacterized membrane protein YgaE (UPF0421/DUF939 family)